MQVGESKEPCTAMERISEADVLMPLPKRRCLKFELEREIGELRRANEILKDALSFFVKDRKR